ncbi:MAG: hypothetical protein IPM16_19305 [Chloroflexi bacterium]|nr:hypothetical protein [Chloroflexota bacterium]
MSQNAAQNRSQQQINAPFRAKSAGVSLVVVLIIGIFYAVNALGLLPSDQAVPDGALTLVIGSIVLIVVVEVALQIVLFIGAGKVEDRTGRDDTIAAQASRNGNLVLTVGVFATFASMFAGFTPFEMGSTLLVAFVLAEAVRFGSQVWYYSRS